METRDWNPRFRVEHCSAEMGYTYGRLEHGLWTFWKPSTMDIGQLNLLYHLGRELNVCSGHTKTMQKTTCRMKKQLVGGFNHFWFSIIYGIILPIDFHILHHQPYSMMIDWSTRRNFRIGSQWETFRKPWYLGIIKVALKIYTLYHIYIS